MRKGREGRRKGARDAILDAFTKHTVILGLVPRIHAFASAARAEKTWMLGTSPSMTV
jgi:hypothetical protein